MQRSRRRLTLQLAPGILAFLVAALSVADMFIPRPYDGVILEADVPGVRIVRAVVPGSGADRAGIRPADVIVGIDRTILDSQTHAQELLNRHAIGDSVSYMVRSGGSSFEVEVELGRRQIGGNTDPLSKTVPIKQGWKHPSVNIALGIQFSLSVPEFIPRV